MVKIKYRNAPEMYVLETLNHPNYDHYNFRLGFTVGKISVDYSKNHKGRIIKYFKKYYKKIEFYEDCLSYRVKKG